MGVVYGILLLVGSAIAWKNEGHTVQNVTIQERTAFLLAAILIPTAILLNVDSLVKTSGVFGVPARRVLVVLG